MADGKQYETILVEVCEGVGLITLNRPQALNALNAQVMGDVLAALADCDANADVGCVVITGSQKAFAAGGARARAFAFARAALRGVARARAGVSAAPAAPCTHVIYELRTLPWCTRRNIARWSSIRRRGA